MKDKTNVSTDERFFIPAPPIVRDTVDWFNLGHVGICYFHRELGMVFFQRGHIERRIEEGAQFMWQLYEYSEIDLEQRKGC